MPDPTGGNLRNSLFTIQPWFCYHYDAFDNEATARGYTEQQVCEAHAGFKNTGGANANYPGCGGCYCCAPSSNPTAPSTLPPGG